MIYVTGKTLSSGGTTVRHITHLCWDEVGTNNAGKWTRAQMVNWIDNDRGDARVRNAFGVDAQVITVHPSDGDAYVRTTPDGTTRDNLLNLPDC